ncbi:MAG: YraN family protein [Micrococcales bacterium]
MNQNQNVGRYGEDRAADFLTRLGYSIIERNWRGPSGEIDIIAKDGHCLVFAEVKTRTRLGFGHPFESITATKVRRMRALAAQWCQARSQGIAEVRLDAVSVLVHQGRVTIEHIKQVY